MTDELLRHAEIPVAARVLAAAFRDNPLNVAVIGAGRPRRRLRCNQIGMRALLPVARERGLVLAARRAGRVCGALIATPPGCYPLPAPPFLARLRAWLGQGSRVASRWSRAFEALDALHPVEPHWYLGTLGVAPEEQGRGFGRGLLERWLARVGGDELPCYLETDREGNLGFYRRAGFEVTGETEVLGAHIWQMHRAV